MVSASLAHGPEAPPLHRPITIGRAFIIDDSSTPSVDIFPIFRFFDLPRELRDLVYDFAIPDFKVKSYKCKVQPWPAPFFKTKHFAKLKNEEDWEAFVDLFCTSKRVRAEVLDVLRSALSKKESIFAINLIGHGEYGEESIPGSKPIRPLPDDLFSKSIFQGMRSKGAKISLPISLVDLSAHRASLAQGRTLRELMKSKYYRNMDREIISMVDMIFLDNASSATQQWSVRFEWKILAVFELVRSRDGADDWVMVDGASEIEAMQAEMRGMLEDMVRAEMGQLFPTGVVLDYERLYRIQKMVRKLTDRLSGMSRVWTTRIMEDSIDAIRGDAHRGVRLSDGQEIDPDDVNYSTPW